MKARDEKVYLIMKHLVDTFRLNSISNDEKDIFIEYFFHHDITIENIGIKYGITYQRVSQKAREIYRKIRNELCKLNKIQEEYDGIVNQLNLLQTKYDLLYLEFKRTRIYFPALERLDKLVDERVLNYKIIDLDLSTRTYNCLKAADVQTIGQLLLFKRKDLLKFRNWGNKSQIEIEDCIRSMGIDWDALRKELYTDKLTY